MVYRILVLACITLALSACQSTPGGPASSPIQQSATFDVGTDLISAERAGQIFGELCVRHAPTFEGTEAAAAGYGFVQYTVYGNYFHPRENLSVALVDGDCAMTFASTDNPLDIEAALLGGLELVTPEGRAANLSADFRRRPWPYYRATISTRPSQPTEA